MATFIYYYVEGLKFFKKSWAITGLFVLLTIYWASANSKLINKQVRDSQYVFTAGRLILAKLTEEKYRLPQEAYVMVPNPLMPLGEDFLKKFYSNGSIQFLFIDTRWKQKIPDGFDLNKLYVYDYSKQSSVVVDRSEEYRKEFKKSSP